ncbi:MAG: hypothetical protein MUF43_03655 [Flavobacterium sp.]|jgi:hypothetical protein|nr:hypothetical protein [Flavobacterium sp.]MCU0470237.1 hypothetical protein [Arcicella sp.]
MKEGVNRQINNSGSGVAFGFEQIDVQTNQNNLAYDFNLDSEGFFRVPYFNTEEQRWENVPMRDFAKHLKPSNSAIVFGSTFSGTQQIPLTQHSVLLSHDSNVDVLVFLDKHFDFERTISVVNASNNNCIIRIVSQAGNNTLKEFSLERANFAFDPNKTFPIGVKIQKIANVYYEEKTHELTKYFFEGFDNGISDDFLQAQLSPDGDNFIKIPLYYAEEDRLVFADGVTFSKSIARRFSINQQIEYIEGVLNPPNLKKVNIKNSRRFVVKQTFSQNIIVLNDFDFVQNADLINQFQNVVLEFINLKDTTISVMYGNEQNYQLAFILNPSNNADTNQNKMNKFIFVGNEFVRI